MPREETKGYTFSGGRVLLHLCGWEAVDEHAVCIVLGDSLVDKLGILGGNINIAKGVTRVVYEHIDLRKGV